MQDAVVAVAMARHKIDQKLVGGEAPDRSGQTFHNFPMGRISKKLRKQCPDVSGEAKALESCWKCLAGYAEVSLSVTK